MQCDIKAVSLGYLRVERNAENSYVARARATLFLPRSFLLL